MSAFQLVCVFCIHYSHHSLREENQEVAPDLFLSVSAVMTLVTELCKKRGMRNISQDSPNAPKNEEREVKSNMLHDLCPLHTGKKENTSRKATSRIE